LLKQPTQKYIIFADISLNENHEESYSSQMTLSEQLSDLTVFQ